MANYEEIRKVAYSYLADIAEFAKAAKLDVDEVINCARMEMVGYLMYLSCSDGRITQTETKIVEALTGFTFTPAEMTDFVKEHNIYSESFEKTVPTTLKFLVKIDQILGEAKYAERMVAFYLEFAKMLVNADGDVADNEVSDVKIYTDMMIDYIEMAR